MKQAAGFPAFPSATQRPHRLAVVLWTVLGGLLPGEPVHHITVKVTVDTSNDYKDIAGSSAKSKKQSRQLDITLGNNDKQPVEQVSVK